MGTVKPAMQNAAAAMAAMGQGVGGKPPVKPKPILSSPQTPGYKPKPVLGQPKPNPQAAALAQANYGQMLAGMAGGGKPPMTPKPPAVHGSALGGAVTSMGQGMAPKPPMNPLPAGPAATMGGMFGAMGQGQAPQPPIQPMPMGQGMSSNPFGQAGAGFGNMANALAGIQPRRKQGRGGRIF